MLVPSVCLALSLLVPGADDEPVEFVLSGGAAVRGAVLKETASTVWVDVGHTVLEIPAGSILERRAPQAAEASGASEEKGLYTVGGNARVTVQEAVDRFGEGVVVVRTPMGTGSGFVIREDGYVVTNAHVVQGEIEVSVVLYLRSDDGFEKKILERCKIVAVNPWVDLALLKIDEDELGDTRLTRVALGRSDEVKVGEPVFAIGAPLGMDRSVSEGIVSLTNRSMDGKVYVQTTAAVNPGNSGGPLFNARGEVIAVNTLGYMFFEGLNMSIPVDAVKHFVDNRDAFAYDRDNPNSGYRYLQPPGRPQDDDATP